MYVGESQMSEDIEQLPEVLDGGDTVDWMIGDTGSGILLMVTQTSESLY